MKTIHLAYLASATVVGAAVLIGCSDKQKESAIKPIASTPAAAPAAAPPHKAEIPSYALTPYTPDQYPKTFAQYGSRMGEVEAFRRKAAESAASNPECKQVEMAELSTTQGSVSDMHLWVDCTDSSGGMVRYRFSENELRSSTVAAVSEADKAWSEAAAVKACEQQIMDVATHPSTVSINKFSHGFQKFEPLGNVAVQMDFKAKNGFGLELKYTARCLYSPGSSTGEITVKERNG